VECGSPNPHLPPELALTRNAIVKRDSGKLSGTGPFRIEDWQPRSHLTLRTSEDYWRGRAFVDSIEIEMGKNYGNQLTNLEFGKAQLIEVPPDQIHRVSMEGRRIDSSQPVELIALMFDHDSQSAEEMLLREALALSIERTSIRNVLLQGAGQPAGGILPNWISGY